MDGPWRESSPESLRAAAEAGADAVEFDVRVTADGIPIVSHDCYARSCTLPLHQRTHSEVAGDVDLLPDLLTECSPMRSHGGRPLDLVVEIKCGPLDPDHDPRYRIVPSVLTALESADVVDRSVVASFDPLPLELARSAVPSLSTAWIQLDVRDPGPILDRTGSSGFDWLFAFGPFVDAQLVTRCRRGGIRLGVWTVDDPAHVRRFADLGVDAVITNRADLARAALSRG
jgi:glycerophosphoryl diester phosphodiesterase